MWCHVVVAPVTRVDIVLLNNIVTCQSGGIYPRPQLTWSVSSRPATVAQDATEVHEDDQGLYDISGSLRTVYNDTVSTYSCSVQNEHSAKKAMMRPLRKSLNIRMAKVREKVD